MSDVGSEEKSPLLNQQLPINVDYEASSVQNEEFVAGVPRQEEYVIAISEHTIDDSNVKNTSKSQTGPSVACRVCGSNIVVGERSNQHVVKCTECQEATPIRAAPPGKKYVRCPCNCLLLCKAASNRIACPRPNCQRVITLGTTQPPGASIRAPIGTHRVSCVYCSREFVFNTMNDAPAKCPHCKQISSVGEEYASKRAFKFGALAIMTFCVAVCIMLISIVWARGMWSVHSLWIIALIIAIFFFVRYIQFKQMKISTVIGAY